MPLKKKFFSHMRKQCKEILKDVIHLYKNFIHWNISKILISLWTIVLGVILAAPFFIIVILIGVLDPINWTELIGFILNGDGVSYEFTGEIASHPYWTLLSSFFILTCAVIFLLASSYSLLLLAKLFLGYIKGKKLKLSKNLYFSWKHIRVFLALISWNFLYLLAPVIVWLSGVFGIYLLFNLSVIGFELLSFFIALLTVILICIVIYIVYRITFGYVLLAEDTKKKLSPAKSYIKKSIKITKGKSFLKFLFISVIYSFLLLPTTSYDANLESESLLLRDTIVYRSGLVESIKPEQTQYYEYITSEYGDMSDEEILNKIESNGNKRILLFFLSYFLFSGLFVFIIVSFYIRVLSKK